MHAFLRVTNSALSIRPSQMLGSGSLYFFASFARRKCWFRVWTYKNDSFARRWMWVVFALSRGRSWLPPKGFFFKVLSSLRELWCGGPQNIFQSEVHTSDLDSSQKRIYRPTAARFAPVRKGVRKPPGASGNREFSGATGNVVIYQHADPGLHRCRPSGER